MFQLLPTPTRYHYVAKISHTNDHSLAAMSSNVLSPRDSNAQMKPASPEKKVAKSLDVHREELQAKLNSNDT